MKRTSRVLLACLLALFHTTAFSSTLTLINGSLTLNGTDSQVVNPGDSYTSIYTNENSSLTVNGGFVGNLFADDYSEVSMNGGDIGWIRTYGDAHVSLSNGSLSWLVITDNSSVDIYGYDFNYANEILSGRWSNGQLFSFTAVEAIDLSDPAKRTTLPGNITLHAVPIPATLPLFASALLGLFGFSRKIAPR